MSDPLSPVESGPQTWLDIAGEIIDEGVDRDERVSVICDEMTVEIPSQAGRDADHAVWRLNGTIRVSVDGMRGPLAEWVRLWQSHSREKRAEEDNQKEEVQQRSQD